MSIPQQRGRLDPCARMPVLSRSVVLCLLIGGPLMAADWPEPQRVVREELPRYQVQVGPNPTAVRFFEERIRPVLVEHCYECHGNGHHKGGLKLDSLAGFLDGGGNGQVLVPGDPGRGLLMPCLTHTADEEDLFMPPDEKLPDAVIADFATWIRLGAPWPVDGQQVAIAGSATPAGSASVAVGSASVAATAAPPKHPILLGRLHPLVVHFPIACLLLALVAEALVLLNGARWRVCTWFLLAAGTAGAIAAVISGSQLPVESHGPAGERHELLGWITLVASLGSGTLLVLAEWRQRQRWLFRLALLLTAVLVGITGHLGGELVYGSGWPW